MLVDLSQVTRLRDKDQDLWSGYIVLTTGTYQLDNTNMAGTS